MRYLLAVGVLLSLLAVPTHADMLTVNAQFAFGNYETGSFSFNWDTSNNLIVQDTIKSSFIGSLGTFNLTGFGITNRTLLPWLTWRDENKDFIQLAMFDFIGEGFPNTPIRFIELWVDRSNPNWLTLGQYTTGASSGFLTLTPVPEPATLLLSLTGVLSLFLFAIKSKIKGATL